MGRITVKKTGNEKRNSIRSVFAKATMVTLIAGTTLGGTAFNAVPAYANTQINYGTGSEQVNNVEGQDTVFKVFQIFKANKNEDGTMSNFAWPGDEIMNAVIGAIRNFDSNYTSESAQDAADYISKAYKDADGNLTTDQTTILTNKELLNQIAAAVDDIAGYTTVNGGEVHEYAEGYWMAVTDGTSIGVDEDGTSPIFFIASGEPVTILEKTSLPTVEHKVTGTVADNIKTYDLYYYEFEDVMSKGINYDVGYFIVTIDGTDVTKHFKETIAQGSNGLYTLRVSCENILDIPEVTPAAGSIIELKYTVQLNDDCIVGAEGNPNDVKIIYSSNPNTREKSETHTVRDYLYTFGLHVEKKDRDTNVPLAGAKFTIQATDPDDKASKNLYVQEDGRLGTETYEFVTDENGIFNVTGLDAGTYKLHETECPEAYQVLNRDTFFAIEAAYNDDGTISSLSNTVSKNAEAAAGIDTTDDNTVNGDPDTAAIVSTGFVNVTVGNIEKVKMPLSGQNGIWLMVTAGGILLVASASGVVLANRKKKTE